MPDKEKDRSSTPPPAEDKSAEGERSWKLSDSEFLEIVETINKASTLEELFDSFVELAPVSIASYHHFPSLGAFDYRTLGTYRGYNLPTLFKDFYKNYDMRESDPGILAIFAEGGYVWLSELPNKPIVVEAGISEALKAVTKQIGEALCIPLFGPNNRRGYLFIMGGVIKKESSPFLPYQMQALAQLFHARFCLMIQEIERQINLTPREAQVLELLTYGKTNQEIASILELSVSTISGYVKSIFLKLNVSDRVSASMRALSLKVAF